MQEKQSGWQEIPASYVLQQEYNLDHKVGWLTVLGLITVAIGLVLYMALAAIGVMPTVSMERLLGDPKGWLWLLLVLLFALVITLIFMLIQLPIKKRIFKSLTGLRANVEFTITYFSVSVPFYFNKSAYLRSRLLADAILLGVLVAATVGCCFAPAPFNLMAYLALVFFVAGCMDDFYLAYQARRAPQNALFYDMGRRFFIFLPAPPAQSGL